MKCDREALSDVMVDRDILEVCDDWYPDLGDYDAHVLQNVDHQGWSLYEDEEAGMFGVVFHEYARKPALDALIEKCKKRWDLDRMSIEDRVEALRDIDSPAYMVEYKLKPLYKKYTKKLPKALKYESIRRVLDSLKDAKQISDEYWGRLAEELEKDIIEDVDETADDAFSVDDVRLAVGRAICRRLGLEF